MCLGHRGTTVLVYSAQNPHGYVNNYPFIEAWKSWTELAITARVLRNNLYSTSVSVPQPSWNLHAFLPILGFSDCVDMYLSRRNMQGSQAGGRHELPWYFGSNPWSLLSGWVSKESVKCHLFSCFQLVVVGGKAILSEAELLDHLDKCSPPTGVPWEHSIGIKMMVSQLDTAGTDFWTVSAKRMILYFTPSCLWEIRSLSLFNHWCVPFHSHSPWSCNHGEGVCQESVVQIH